MESDNIESMRIVSGYNAMQAVNHTCKGVSSVYTNGTRASPKVTVTQVNVSRSYPRRGATRKGAEIREARAHRSVADAFSSPLQELLSRASRYKFMG